MRKDIKSITRKLKGDKYNKLRTNMLLTLIIYIGLAFLLVNFMQGNTPPSLSDVFYSEKHIIALIIFCVICGFAFLVFFWLYISKTYAIKKSVKTLADTNKLGFANEILSGDYNSNDTVGFSKHLLFDKKFNILVAYDDIVWVYKIKKRFNLTTVLFCTVDGEKHESAIDDLTLERFLKRLNNVLVGYTPQNKLAYETKVKEFYRS